MSQFTKQKTKFHLQLTNSDQATAHGGQLLIDALCRRFGLWERLHKQPALDPRKRTRTGFAPAANIAQLVLTLTSGLKPDAQRLPFARRTRRVHGGRRSAAFGHFVDAAAISRRQAPLEAVAIEDLNLVEPVQVHAGVGALGQQKFQVEFEAAELLVRDQVGGLTVLAVDDAVSRSCLGSQAERRKDALPDDARGGEPLVRRLIFGVPPAEIAAVQQRTPAAFGQVRGIAVGLVVVEVGELLREGRRGEEAEKYGSGEQARGVRVSRSGRGGPKPAPILPTVLHALPDHLKCDLDRTRVDARLRRLRVRDDAAEVRVGGRVVYVRQHVVPVIQRVEGFRPELAPDAFRNTRFLDERSEEEHTSELQ